MLRAGRLNKRITIQEKSKSRTALGEIAETWSDVAEVSAAIEQLKKEEKLSNNTVYTEAERKIFIRWMDGITTRNRIIFKDKIYEITNIPLNDYERNEIHLLVKGIE